MSRVSHAIDRIGVRFDEPNLVANAGLLLVGTLAVRLELERLVEGSVRLSGRVGGARPGRKVLTLVHAIVAGGSHIEHVDVLRSGATQRVLPFRVMAPSTIGTFLRSFSFGHVRQLEAVVGETLRRAWAFGAGPGTGRLVLDVDSTICQVEGKAKQGAAFGYTKVLGYHPLLATRADTGEVLHARMRKGSANTARGARRFLDEVVARVRRAGATGELVIRFDSGFWSNDTIAGLARLDVRYTMAVRTNTKGIAAAIAEIDEDAWIEIDYTPGGQAQVAECIYKGRRLIIRRTRLTDTHQAKLWPDWRHFGFLTDLDGDTVTIDAFHRQHAVVELAIRDLKEGAGMEHVPSGNFSANSAWLQCAVLAHNLIRWTATLGTNRPVDQLTIARTIRTRLLAVPGRLVNLAGTITLRGPKNWPWAQWFNLRLDRLRTLQPTTS
ncbi:MAG: TnpC protein [uncultured Acidimicrobiales bacterium]|uniref:TnpC protein n=1 Tax=uncultured Acidimicrobiales bacterium TaxID=310071 RepID=A0A6J4HVL9_9ACTN|nr:MAG: TnpC protein [uncultured Acidimicrobiales bacterium]